MIFAQAGPGRPLAVWVLRASFSELAAKQIQIKTFDVNLLAIARDEDVAQDGGGMLLGRWGAAGQEADKPGREKHPEEICTTNVYEFCVASANA